MTRNLEYKFVVNDHDQPHTDKAIWEPGENRIITKYLLIHGKKCEYFNCIVLNNIRGVLGI